MGIDSNVKHAAVVDRIEYIERTHLIWIWIKHFCSASFLPLLIRHFSCECVFMCVRTSSIGDDFHIIVLQEFPLETLNQCVCLPIYFFLTLSRIVIVTFIQFTWLLFFVSLFTKLWPPLLLLVFFYILKAEMYTKYRDTPCVFYVSQAIHWFSIIYFFRPQQKYMYTTHNCHSNNVMRFLIESDWGSISLTRHKETIHRLDLSPRTFFSGYLWVCVWLFKCERSCAWYCTFVTGQVTFAACFVSQLSCVWAHCCWCEYKDCVVHLIDGAMIQWNWYCNGERMLRVSMNWYVAASAIRFAVHIVNDGDDNHNLCEHHFQYWCKQFKIGFLRFSR